jgi:40-residue YVTN family beta-propeller repeat
MPPLPPHSVFILLTIALFPAAAQEIPVAEQQNQAALQQNLVAAKKKGLKDTYSGPIAITSDDKFVWVVNRDNNSVSVIRVLNDVIFKVKEIKVGREPRCVAITPDDQKVFVTNMVDGTVTVINQKNRKKIGTIKVGTEPFGCAVTPGGNKLYVANFGSDSVSVISTRFEQVIKTINNVGPKPRGIAIHRKVPQFPFNKIRQAAIDFRDDDDTPGHQIFNGPGLGKVKVYVTHFLAELRSDSRPVDEKEASDDGKEGRVSVISTAKEKIFNTVVLNPLANTGFNSNGSTLDEITVPPATPGTFVTGAFPNLLQSIVVSGDRVYLPNTASSPNGPFNFNVNVQGFLSVFDDRTDTDSGQTINMNSGVQNESQSVKLFITNPIAIAFLRSGTEGWVVSAATNRIIRVQLDANGTPTINAPIAPGAFDGIVRVEVGLNPQGIVLNSTGTRAYVENFISRDVSVVDISTPTPFQIARVPSAVLPGFGTLEFIVHRGHELFNTGIGPAGTLLVTSMPPSGKMSNSGWGSCYSCHPDGLHDGVTWMFPDGPRQSISMESTFAQPQPVGFFTINGAPFAPNSDQRVLNWSAVRDEVQDFERNIRLVSGGEGLINAPIANVIDLQILTGPATNTGLANAGRSADLDAIAAYIAFGVRAPISPLRKASPSQKNLINQGKTLFAAANCQSCHGGEKWSNSRVDFRPPPFVPPGGTEIIVNGQLERFLRKVGTFNPAAFNELRAQAATQAANLPANGADGFNIPSLFSVFAGAPYLHSGEAPTLEAVLENVTHRSAGTGGVDTLTNPNDRVKVVTFLKSIDSNTTPFP